MKNKLIFTLIVGITILTLSPTARAASWNDDSHYVSLGPRNGYYIVRPDSQLLRQLGLYEAPVIDTADWMHHGYGADALAFRFNRKGVLIMPPAYIAQEDPNDFYTRRIGSLTVFRASAMWKLSLAAATLEQTGRMVLYGTTRCRFIIHLKIKATVDPALGDSARHT